MAALGLSQARILAEKIKVAGLRFDKVYASPLKRALKTAEIICAALSCDPPEATALLIERDFGVMTGQLQSRIKELCYPDILQTETITYFLNPLGAETFPDLLKRAEVLLKWLERKHQHADILLVFHGDYGKMVYAQYYQLDWREVLKMFHFGNGDLILLAPDSPASDVHVFKQEQHNL